MNSSEALALNPLAILEILRRRLACWLVPALAGTALAAAYVAARTDRWEASQRLILRNEAAGIGADAGRFVQPADMKTAQETILELAKGRGVIEAALRDMGPPADAGEAWPSETDVAALASAVRVLPPKGAEFGATEVFYVKVSGDSPERAVESAAAVCRQLQARFQQLRDQRAQSMIDELDRSVDLAAADLRAAVAPLARLEQSVGGDLAELRMLLESSSADSDLRRKAVEIENELRQADLAERNQADLVDVLLQVRRDAGQAMTMPGRLLEAQPTLKRLKEGLVDAQLKSARLAGNLTAEHPLLKTALAVRKKIEQDLRAGIDEALRGGQVDLRLAADRRRMLQTQLDAARSRIVKLSGLRAEYAVLASAVEHRTRLLHNVESELADARATRAGARAASLISPVDGPDAGTGPVGPGCGAIVLAGAAAGLALGWAIVFLTEQPSSLDRRLQRLEALRNDRADGASGSFPMSQHGLSLKKGGSLFWGR